MNSPISPTAAVPPVPPSLANPMRVVIIGGGYTAIRAYKFLYKRVSDKVKGGEIVVTVVCPKNYHSFHGFTAEALCGMMSMSSRQSPLRQVLPHARILRAHAERVDLARKTVVARLVNSEKILELPYDHLVLANGSYDTMDTVQGMSSHGWSLKESGGVLSTRNHIIRMIEYADVATDAKEIDESLSFVIAGGGLTGVEIATNLVEMLHSMRKAYPVLAQKRYRVVLVHSGPVLLPQLRPRYAKMADYAVRQVEKWGVEVKLNTKLVRVRDREAIFSDGTTIPTRTVISTIGQSAAIFPGTESLPRVANGLLETDQFLRVIGHDNIWAAGDAAQVMHINGTPCPKTAIWAIVQGNCLGDNLGRTIEGQPLNPFSFKTVAQGACMGVGRAIAEYQGQQFTGWAAWLLRFVGYLYYVPSRRQAFRIFADWCYLPFVGRHQTSLESVGEQMLFNKRNKEAKATIEIPAIVIDD